MNHEREHIEIAKNFLKKSAPYFGSLERKTYKTKEDCEAAKPEAKQVLDLVWQAMSSAQANLDWKDRLRDLF